jgi:hypothetical protein
MYVLGEIWLNISLAQNCTEEATSLAHWASDDLTSNSDKSTELKKGSSLPNIPGEMSSALSEGDEIEIAIKWWSFSVKPKDAEAPALTLPKQDSTSSFFL